MGTTSSAMGTARYVDSEMNTCPGPANSCSRTANIRVVPLAEKSIPDPFTCVVTTTPVLTPTQTWNRSPRSVCTGPAASASAAAAATARSAWSASTNDPVTMGCVDRPPTAMSSAPKRAKASRRLSTVPSSRLPASFAPSASHTGCHPRTSATTAVVARSSRRPSGPSSPIWDANPPKVSSTVPPASSGMGITLSGRFGFVIVGCIGRPGDPL